MSDTKSAQAVCLFQITRDELLAVLKQVSGVVEQSQVMQIYPMCFCQEGDSSILASTPEVEVARANYSPRPIGIFYHGIMS